MMSHESRLGVRMSGVTNRSLVGLYGIGIPGSEASAVVQVVPAHEVDWATFSVMMIRLGGAIH